MHQSMLYQLFLKACSNSPSDTTMEESSSVKDLDEKTMMRMLLLGPSNSFQLRSSLSMDVAYNIASNQNNRFEKDLTQNGISSRVSSTILVPRHSHEIYSLLDFPLKCRPYSRITPTNESIPYWDHTTLSRIYIHQIDGIYQFIQTLASMQLGATTDEKMKDQPQVLIVQDIHEYIRERKDDNNNNENAASKKHLTTEELMRLNHMLALITDACTAFDEKYHLLVTCDSNILPIHEHSHLKHVLFRHLTSVASLIEMDEYCLEQHQQQQKQQQKQKQRTQNESCSNVSSLPESLPFKIISSWNVRMEYDPWQDLALKQQYLVKKNDMDTHTLQYSQGTLHLASIINEDLHHYYNGDTTSNCGYAIPDLLDTGGYGDDEKDIIWEIHETV